MNSKHKKALYMSAILCAVLLIGFSCIPFYEMLEESGTNNNTKEIDITSEELQLILELKRDIKVLSGTDIDDENNDKLQLLERISELRKEMVSKRNYKDPEYDAAPVLEYYVNPSDKWQESRKEIKFVELDVQILKDGLVGVIAVTSGPSSLSRRLDFMAYTKVKQWKYKPALKNDKPIECWIKVTVEFPGKAKEIH